MDGTIAVRGCVILVDNKANCILSNKKGMCG